MHFNLTRNTFLILTIILVVLAGAYTGLYFYIHSMHNKINNINQEIAFQERIQSQEASLKFLAKDIAPNLETLESYVISSEDDIEFIKYLENLGKEEGVNLKIVSATESEENEFKKIVFQVMIEGSWSRTIHFVDLLESIPYKMVVQEVRLEQLDASSDGSAASGSRNWRAAMQFSVVKQK